MGIKKEYLLEVKKLTKKFNDVVALDNINFDVNYNEIIGIVGNNGAGKTTLFRLILDLLKPDKGIILSKGKQVFQSEHWKNYTGAYIDEKFLINYLTSTEYLYMIGQLRDMSFEEITKSIGVFKNFMNGEILDNKKLIRNLSSGNKQKVGIISAFLFSPELVILDEPFNYIDPTSQLILLKILQEYVKDKKASILLSSHNLQYISEICDRITVIEKGKLINIVHNNSNALMILKRYFSQNQ